MTQDRTPLRRQSRFRRLWVAQTVSRWGDVFWTVAVALLVLRLTGSGVGVAGVVVAEILPVVLLGPLAGVVVDHVSPRRVMVAADLWRAALAAVLPFVDGNVAAVYAVAFGLSAGSAFFGPAAASLLPALVDEDQLVAANSGLWSAAVLSQIALAPVAGAVVHSAGYGPAFAIDAVTFVVSALVLARLPAGPSAAGTAAGDRAWFRRAREGATLILADRLLRVLAGAQLLAALSAGATSALLVVLAREHLGATAREFGLLMAAIGAGAALGPLLLSRLNPDPRRPAPVFATFFLRGAVDLVLAAFRSLPLAAVALVGYGVGTSTGMVTYNSFLQVWVPEGARGRVFAGFDVLWQAGRLASVVAGGLVADAAGIRAVYWFGGALLVVAGACGFAGLRRPNVVAGERV